VPQREIDKAFVRSLLPARPDAGHKGMFGHVFVIAGSRGFTGAAKLTADGAARSGVGLVTVGTPKPLGDIVASALTEPMTMLLPATDRETLAEAALDPALEFASNKNAVVLGPGLSQHPETRRFVLEFVRRCAVAMIIDADGLNCLAADPQALVRKDSIARVVTPHPGEMARLTGRTSAEIQMNRSAAAAAFAAQYGCVVVLKGHRTVVADGPDNVFTNPTGNAGLASGGTGDVLAGLLGGLLAQGMTGLNAAVVGVYLHGLAGDLAAAKLTQRGMIAGDVVLAIPEAWRAVEVSD